MQLYTMLDADNSRILSRIESLDAVDPSNILERNIRFERLKEDILQTYETRRLTLYAALLHYAEAREAIDYVRHLQVQIAGLLDALTRESMITKEWMKLYTTLKKWISTSISLEQNRIIAVAKCYLIEEDKIKLIEEIAVAKHFLDRSQHTEDDAEEGFNEDYVQYKKGVDAPGKSHLLAKSGREQQRKAR